MGKGKNVDSRQEEPTGNLLFWHGDAKTYSRNGVVAFFL